MLLKLLVELERDADHYFSFVSIGVGDVVNHTIKVCSKEIIRPHVIHFAVRSDASMHSNDWRTETWSSTSEVIFRPYLQM